MIPILYKSHLFENFPSSTSGALYKSVPLFFAVEIKSVDNPKSPSFIIKSVFLSLV